MALPAIMAICSLLMFIGVGISSPSLAYFQNALFPPGIPWPVYITDPDRVRALHLHRPPGHLWPGSWPT